MDFYICDRRTAVGDSEHGGGIENGVASEIRRPRNLLRAFTDLGEGVEEVPEGGTVDDGVVHGASDEHAVGEFGDLDGGEGVVVAGVGDRVIVGEKLLKQLGTSVIFCILHVFHYELKLHTPTPMRLCILDCKTWYRKWEADLQVLGL